MDVAVIDTGVDYTHPDLAPNYKGGFLYDAPDGTTTVAEATVTLRPFSDYAVSANGTDWPGAAAQSSEGASANNAAECQAARVAA